MRKQTCQSQHNVICQRGQSRMSVNELRRTHSPFAFQLHFAQQDRTAFAPIKIPLLIGAQNFPGAVCSPGYDRRPKYFSFANVRRDRRAKHKRARATDRTLGFCARSRWRARSNQSCPWSRVKFRRVTRSASSCGMRGAAPLLSKSSDSIQSLGRDFRQPIVQRTVRSR